MIPPTIPDSTTTAPEADLPGFRQPPPPLRDQPGPTTRTWESRAAELRGQGLDDRTVEAILAEEAAAADVGRDEPAETLRTPGAGPSPASTHEVAAAASAVIGTAFGATSLFLHNRLAPGDTNDLWIARDEEVAAVAEPLGRIVARHAPITGGRASDLADGIEAGVAVAGYAVTNLRRTAELASAIQQAEQDAAGA